MKWLKLELFSFSNELSTRLQYRTDFFISVFANGLSQIAIPIYTLLLYGVSNGFPGWSMGAALLLSSYVSLAQGISRAFFGGIIWNTIDRVREGTMDIFLLAPTSPLGYFINRSIDVEDLGRVLFGLAATTYALVLINATWQIVLALIAYIVIPVLFFATVAIAASAFSIRFVDSYRIYDIERLIGDVAKYPTSIFPKIAQLFFVSILPIAALGYAPLNVFINQATALLLLSSISILVLFGVSVVWWHKTLKNYSSAGG